MRIRTSECVKKSYWPLQKKSMPQILKIFKNLGKIEQYWILQSYWRNFHGIGEFDPLEGKQLAKSLREKGWEKLSVFIILEVAKQSQQCSVLEPVQCPCAKQFLKREENVVAVILLYSMDKYKIMLMGENTSNPVSNHGLNNWSNCYHSERHTGVFLKKREIYLWKCQLITQLKSWKPRNYYEGSREQKRGHNTTRYVHGLPTLWISREYLSTPNKIW